MGRKTEAKESSSIPSFADLGEEVLETILIRRMACYVDYIYPPLDY